MSLRAAHLPRGNREFHMPQGGLGPPLVTVGPVSAVSESSWDVLGPAGGTWLWEVPGDSLGGAEGSAMINNPFVSQSHRPRISAGEGP